MLTLQDCIDLTELDRAEVDAIADHEGLVPIVALGKAVSMLAEPYGPVAIRQMILDDIEDALARGKTELAVYYTWLYRRSCVRHPGGLDRRQMQSGSADA